MLVSYGSASRSSFSLRVSWKGRGEYDCQGKSRRAMYSGTIHSPERIRIGNPDL